MYKIYLNDNPIYILKPEKLNQLSDNETIKIIYEKDLKGFKKLFADLISGHKINKIFILTNNTAILFKKLKSEISQITAGGGMVLNEKNELLMIKRHNRWDLPKGKQEKGEKIQDTALREVQEECGINELKIIRKLKPTYHIYQEKDTWILKKTCWYQMFSSDLKVPEPQTVESITQVLWLNKKGVLKNMSNTYPNISELLNRYYL